MPKKILLFADSEVGLDITYFLIENFYNDILHIVVINKHSKIYDLALKNSIDCSIYGSKKYNSFIASANFDIGFLIWWPKIIPEKLIDKAAHGFINTHPSLLPFSRGKHYNFWTIVEKTKFGVSLHYVNKDIDSGDIIYQKEINYDWLDNGQTLFFKAQTEMVRMFKEFYPLLSDEKLSRTKQDLSKGSYHHSSEIDEISKLDLNKKYELEYLLNILRARTFDGYPACSFYDPVLKKSYYVRINISEVPEDDK